MRRTKRIHLTDEINNDFLTHPSRMKRQNPLSWQESLPCRRQGENLRQQVGVSFVDNKVFISSMSELQKYPPDFS